MQFVVGRRRFQSRGLSEETCLVGRIEDPMRFTIGDWPIRKPKAVEAFPELSQKTRTAFGDPPPVFFVGLCIGDWPCSSSVPNCMDLTEIDVLMLVMQDS